MRVLGSLDATRSTRSPSTSSRGVQSAFRSSTCYRCWSGCWHRSAFVVQVFHSDKGPACVNYHVATLQAHLALESSRADRSAVCARGVIGLRLAGAALLLSGGPCPRNRNVFL